MRRALRTLLSGLVVVLVAANVSLAQVGSTAQITGTVKDTSGAVLPGADVTATQTDTGFKRSSVTDTDGNYTLSNLPDRPVPSRGGALRVPHLRRRLASCSRSTRILPSP